jgi:hypothetical protein
MAGIELVRTSADEVTIGLLRRLADGRANEAEIASTLFSMSTDATGEVFTDALHIAAEATTDNDLELARRLWLELLLTVDEREIVTSSTAASEEAAALSFPSRSLTLTETVTVPA